MRAKKKTSTRYRTMYEIMETILETTAHDGGTTKTRLTYSAYYDQNNEMLEQAQ